MNTRSFKVALLLLSILIMGIFIMPQSWKQYIPFESVREPLLAKKANFGLDLVGGRQIDYEVDLSEVRRLNSDDDPENDRDEDEVLRNIADILRRRIDPQGTRELNIYTSDFDDEKHVVVEITADLDNEATINALQQVIDLEFKERKGTTEITEEETAALRQQAEEFLGQVNQENFGEVAAVYDGDNYSFEPEKQYWRDTLENTVSPDEAEGIWNAEPGTFFPRVFETTSTSVVQGDDGNFELVETPQFLFLQTGEKEVVERTKTEPGEDFETVRQEVSEKPDVANVSLLEINPDYQSALFELQERDTSDVLESETEYAFFQILPAESAEQVETFVSGVYISKETADARVKIDQARERINSTTTTAEEEQLTVSEAVFAFDLSVWEDTELGGAQFTRARVGRDPNTNRPLVEVLFNDEGSQLFEELTERNIGNQIGIFVGGVLISAPNVNEKISGGSAVITMGNTNYGEAQQQAVDLARQLNGGSTPAPFVEKGQFKIGATLGTIGLQKSLQAGAIGLLIVALFMLVVYRFLGLIAVLALGFYALFILFLLEAHLSFGIATLLGIIITVVALRSFSSLEKNEFVSLGIALLLGMMTTIIVNSSIVLTLAGVAGIVLSIGMAVDANILIFERVKEEVSAGKNFSTAAAIGFERAWSSIRDSNLSSLITCMILWIFGSAVIKGFAAALAMGIVISMLTAITVTRNLVEILITPKMARNKKALIGGGK